VDASLSSAARIVCLFVFSLESTICPDPPTSALHEAGRSQAQKSQTIKIVQVTILDHPAIIESVLVATCPDCIRSARLSSVNPQGGTCVGSSGTCLPGHRGGSNSFCETKIPAAVDSRTQSRTDRKLRVVCTPRTLLTSGSGISMADPVRCLAIRSTEMKILVVEIAIRTAAATCSTAGELVSMNLGLAPCFA